jgi:hypothetical protein
MIAIAMPKIIASAPGEDLTKLRLFAMRCKASITLGTKNRAIYWRLVGLSKSRETPLRNAAGGMMYLPSTSPVIFLKKHKK